MRRCASRGAGRDKRFGDPTNGSLISAIHICLIGQQQPLEVDLPHDSPDDMLVAALRVEFLIGHMTKSDVDVVYWGVMIATNLLQCVIDA